MNWKALSESPRLQIFLGVVLSEYLRLVWKTNRFTLEPPKFYDQVGPDVPFIVAMWHGQHFMMPFFKRPPLKAKSLISRHGDGNIQAFAAARLGVGAVRGAGDHNGQFHLKGGVGGFKGMITALREGYNVALTADFPKVARVAGRGSVLLARFSGRPILPVAVATSRRIVLANWDRTTVNLPFGRIAIVVGSPIRVAASANEQDIEDARKAVEERLNTATARAYEIVDRH